LGRGTAVRNYPFVFLVPAVISIITWEKSTNGIRYR
jgi:hypothetical protein